MLHLDTGFVRCALLLLLPACSKEPAPRPAAVERTAASAAPAPAQQPREPASDWSEVLQPYRELLVGVPDGAARPWIDWDAAMLSASGDSTVERRGTGFYVMGCKLTLNFGDVKKCLDSKIAKLKSDVNRRVKEARQAAEKSFKAKLAAAEKQAAAKLQQLSSQAADYRRQVASLNGQLAGFEAKMKRAVEQAKKQAAAQAKATAERALRDAQRKLTAELARSGALQRTVAELREEAKKFANAVVLQADWQKALFRGVAQLRLGGLLACVQREAFAGKTDFAKAVEQFSRDPLQFTKTTVRELAEQLATHFGALVHEELTDLAEGRPFPTDAQLVGRAFDKLALIAEKTGPGKCVFAYARPQLEKSSVAMAQAARQIAADMRKAAEKTLREKIMPALFSSVTKTLQQTLAAQLDGVGVAVAGVPDALPPQISELLLSQREMKRVAAEVLFRRNVHERFAVADVRLAALLDPSTAEDAAQQHIADLKKLVQGTQDYEALYLEIGVEMLREMGHKYVRSKVVGHGGHLLDEAMGLLQLTEGTVEKVAEAVCGLIPEAGAAVCAIVVEIIDMVYQKGIPTLEATAQRMMVGAVDELADRLREQLLSKQTLATIRENSGPLGEVLRALPHEQAIGLWAGAVLKDELAMLNKHFDRVVALAEKAGK